MPQGGQLGGFGAGYGHLARSEDERGGFGVADAHDEGVEFLAQVFDVAGVL